MSRCLSCAWARASVGLSQMCVLGVFCLLVQMGALALVGSTEAGTILVAGGKSPGFCREQRHPLLVCLETSLKREGAGETQS